MPALAREALPDTPVPSATVAASPREHRVTMQDGRRLFVAEYGPFSDSRPALLCLPGLTRNHRDFSDLAARLSGDRRVVVADMRGRGGSERDPDPRNYAPERALHDVLNIVTAHRLHGCVVLGTSYGGLLAMGVAVARPGALAGVILNDISPEFEAGERDFILGYVKAMKVQPSWDAAAAYARDLVGRDWNKDEQAWLRIARQSYVEGADGMLRLDYDPKIAWPLEHAAEGPATRDLWSLFRALGHVPVLTIRGALSRVLSEEALARMQEALPDMESATVPGVGHAPMLDEPEAARAIDTFLERF